MRGKFSMDDRQERRDPRRRQARGLGGVCLLAAVLLLGGCSDERAAASGATSGAASGPASGSYPGAAQAASAPAPRLQKVAVARGKIEVEGGLIDLAAASSGTVIQLSAHEGETVAAGTVLLRLDDGVGEQAAGVAAAEVRLARERVRAAEGRVPELRASAARYAQAAREGAAPRQQADGAQQRLADAQAEAAVAQAELAVAIQRLEMARAMQAQRVLKAPEAGTIVRLMTQRGAYVQAGAAVLTLLPEQPLIVRAELNAAYVDAVKVGMQATVVPDMDGDDDSQRLPKARVIRISPMYGQGRLQEEAQRGPVRVVECVLAFEREPAARVGQNVRVIFHE